MDPIRFIKVDDSLKKEKDILKEIEDIVKRDTRINKNVYVGKKFIKALIYASRSIHGDKYKLKQSVLSPEMIEKILRFEAVKKIRPGKIKKKFNIGQIFGVKKKEEKPKKEEEKIVIEEEPKKEIRDLLIKDHKILARGYLERGKGKVLYVLLEPDVNLVVLEMLKEDVKEEIKKDNNKVEDDEFLERELKKIYKKIKLEYGERDLLNFKYYLYRDIIRYGKIDPLFYDDKINSIIYDSGNVKVEFEHEKIDTEIKLEKEEIKELFEKFAKLVGKKLSEKDPILTGNIGKFKLHATYSKTDPKFVLER